MVIFPQIRHQGAGLFALSLLVMAGCDRKIQPAESVPSTTPVPSMTPETKASAAATGSAFPNTSAEVAAQLDVGGPLYFYLSTEAWLTGLSKKITELKDAALPMLPAGGNQADRQTAERVLGLVTDLVRRSGLEQVTGVGASSIEVERGVFRNKFFAHHHPGKGDGFLWLAIGKAPRPLRELDLLPANTALANFGDFNLAEVIEIVQQTIGASGIPEAKQGLQAVQAQVLKATGTSLDDLLKSLAGSLGMVVTLNPNRTITVPIEGKQESLPEPGLALLMQVKDDRLFQLIEKAFAGNPQVARHDDAELRLRSMAVPVTPEWQLRPAVAQWGGYLIVASEERLIREIIAVQKDGKGFRSGAEFSKLTAGLPTEGNSFQIATQRFADAWNRFQGQIIKSQASAMPGQAALLEKLMAFQKASPSYGVSAHLENGWLTVSRGAQGPEQLLVPLVVVPAAIAASAALPAFSKAQGQAQSAKSLSNARQIAVACMLYANDNDQKFPPTLDALVPKYLADPQVFRSPFSPGEAVGYRYTAGLMTTSPAGTVLLEDKFASKEKVRIQVRVDGSGEIVPEP